MPATFLGIPRELRDRIYSFVWSSPGRARLGSNHDFRCAEDPTEEDMYEPQERMLAEGEPGDGERTDDFGYVARDNATSLIHFRFPVWLELTIADVEDELDAMGLEDRADMMAEMGYDHLRPGHKLHLLSKSVNSSLLFVNKQIHAEALPIFYANTTLVFDVDGLSALRFLCSLPLEARKSVQRITLRPFALDMDGYPGSRIAWAGNATEPVNRTREGKKTMVTPFGAFLASKVPKLQHVALYISPSCADTEIDTLAPLDLAMLLRDGHLKQLDYIFFAADRPVRSQESCDRLMGPHILRFVDHAFELDHPAERDAHPDTPEEQAEAKSKRIKARQQYAEQHKDDFEWRWASQDVDVGVTENGVAIISQFKKTKSDTQHLDESTVVKSGN